MEEERQDKINHENKLLYKKMTAILKKGTGTGNVSPSIGIQHPTQSQNQAI